MNLLLHSSTVVPLLFLLLAILETVLSRIQETQIKDAATRTQHKSVSLDSVSLDQPNLTLSQTSTGPPKRHSSLSHDSQAIYAYFETPLDQDVGHIGPSEWKNLFRTRNNQCGGNGQINGFGQSPVMIPFELVTEEQCRPLQSWKVLESATCSLDDLTYQIQKNGLSAMVKNKSTKSQTTTKRRKLEETSHGNHQKNDYDPICHLGIIQMPNGDTYKAVEILVKSHEHFLEGFPTKSELQIFHMPTSSTTHSDTTTTEKFVLSHLFDVFQPDQVNNLCRPSNSFYEIWLYRFEQAARETRMYCKNNPQGSRDFNLDTIPDSVLRSQQQIMNCVDVFSELADYPFTCADDYYSDYRASYDGSIPNIYSPFSEYYNLTSLYYYKGSLTAPPCSETVHWAIAHNMMYGYISHDQFTRMTILHTCAVDSTTCKFTSASSEFGTNSRPPQKLYGRKVIKYCDDGTISSDPDLSAMELEPYEVPKAPKPYYALLYPWFATILGVFIFYILTRSYLHVLPYTAVMFLLGTIMGVVISASQDDDDDQLTRSAIIWENIDSELLLLSFLPGLLFKDAYGLDIHLFQKSLIQITIMGFPMVLMGTLLMSLVGMYVLPYDWTFSLSMTFGAIVSATDPVAVNSLLNELGAPPRLKMHVSGESLLNDGSAIVFFTIFKNIFLYEQGIHGGKDYSVGEGIEMFFKMSLGAVAIGLAFGLGLVFLLFMLNHRFSREECIVQITATIATAYLCYYVAEAILHMSGVLAVVICGIVTQAFGSTYINDTEMMAGFWELVEHLLNTLLFLLGGLVWGSVISNLNVTRPETFSGTDWGYLLAVFLLMTIIRFFLFGLFYPIISRIGLKSDWKEAVFQAFGGLRGAVGIALAIALDNEVIQETVRIDTRRAFTSQLFGITGGISLLTLFVNGVLAGPLLKKLGLGRASDERKKIIHHYHEQMQRNTLENLVRLLGNDRFKNVDADILRRYLPELRDVTCAQIELAVQRVKGTTPIHLYCEPNLGVFEHYYTQEGKDFGILMSKAKLKTGDRFYDAVKRVLPQSYPTEQDWAEENPSLSTSKLQELRLVCLELLKTQYQKDIRKGYIDSRYGEIDFELLHSVALCEDEVSQGSPIETWKHLGGFIRCTAKCVPGENSVITSSILLTSSFIQAHKETMSVFRDKFGLYRFLTPEERKVIDECKSQVNTALNAIEEEDEDMVKQILSHQLCFMILNNGAIAVSDYVKSGLLKDTEAEHIYEEIEKKLKKIEMSLHV